jgi:hypothetical protein
MYKIGIDSGGTKINIGLFKENDFDLIDKENISVKEIS